MGDGLPREHDTPPTPAPEPTPAAASGKLECEFCKCQLGPSGEYLKLSDRAKELRALEDTLGQTNEKLAASQADLAEALRERDEARAEVRQLQNPEDGSRNARGQTLDLKW